MKFNGRFPHSPLEFYGRSIFEEDGPIPAATDLCPFRPLVGRSEKCDKTRKSDRSVTIGSCIAEQNGKPVILSPWRLLEGGIVLDEAAASIGRDIYEYTVIPEFTVPGGNVDYLLVGTSDSGRVMGRIVGLELQTMDTTGSLFQAKLDYFRTGIVAEKYKYNMNWKHIAKLTLIQCLQKAPSFAGVDGRYIWAVQDVLLDYLVANFDLSEFRDNAESDPFAFYSYEVQFDGRKFSIHPSRKVSTSLEGLSRAVERGNDPVFDMEHKITTALSGSKRRFRRNLSQGT